MFRNRAQAHRYHPGYHQHRTLHRSPSGEHDRRYHPGYHQHRTLHRSPSREHDRLQDRRLQDRRLQDRRRRDVEEVDTRVRQGRDLMGLNSTQRTCAKKVYPEMYYGRSMAARLPTLEGVKIRR